MHKENLYVVNTPFIQEQQTQLRISTDEITLGKHVMYTTFNPTFIYSKTGVCRGIPFFLIFAPKHRLCLEQK